MIKFKRLLPNLMMSAIVVAASVVAFYPTAAYAQSGQTSTTGKWTVAASQDPSNLDYSSLQKISCPAVDSCQAVGSYVDTNNDSHTLIESYDGTSWKLQPDHDPANTGSMGLNDLSCVSTTFCQAVGQYRDSSFVQRGLIYTYDGTSWTAMDSPQPMSAVYTALQGVDCVSTTFCQAVGTHQDIDGNSYALVVTYDGTGWNITTTSDPVNSSYSSLNSVDCTSTTFCQAVGDSRDINNFAHTQIQTYDGTSWSIATSPDPINDANSAYLRDVTCLSTTFCQTIGFYTTQADSLIDRALTLSYDGTSWSLAPSANYAGVEDGALDELQCVSTAFCLAIGSSSDASYNTQPVMHLYNSAEWNVVTLPQPNNAVGGALTAMSCTSSTNCQVLGWYRDSDSKFYGIAYSYDGANWNAAAGLEPAGYRSAIADAMDCASATSCQAVGQYLDAENQFHILLGSYAPVVASTNTFPSTSTSSGSLVSQSKGAGGLLAWLDIGNDSAQVAAESEVPSDEAETAQNGTDLNVTRDKTAHTTDSALTKLRHNWWAVIVVGAILIFAATALFRHPHKKEN